MVAVRSSQVIVCDVYFTDTKTSYMDCDVGLAFRSVQTHFARRRPYRVATHPGDGGDVQLAREWPWWPAALARE